MQQIRYFQLDCKQNLLQARESLKHVADCYLVSLSGAKLLVTLNISVAIVSRFRLGIEVFPSLKVLQILLCLPL